MRTGPFESRARALPHWWVAFTSLALSGAAAASDLMQAVDAGDDQRVDRLLDQGADPDGADDGMTPLMRAVTLGNRAMVNRLLEGGAAVDVQAVHGPAIGARFPSPSNVRAHFRRRDTVAQRHA